MNQKDLTKTFMMVLNWEKYWSPWFIQQDIIPRHKLS